MTRASDRATISKFIFITIMLVVLFIVIGALLPELENAGDQLNQTNQCNTLNGCLFNITNSSTSPCRLEANQSLVCDQGTGDIPLSDVFGFQIMGMLVVALVLLLIVAGTVAASRRGLF